MKQKLLFIFLFVCTLWQSLYTMNCQTSSTSADIISQLYKHKIVKTGKMFVLKDGSASPIYIDMRICFSHLKLLSMLAEAIVNSCTEEYDHVCGVPYGAVPLATIIALKENKSLLMTRKEEKNYGTKKLIEGIYKPGDKVLIVEDVITSGSSILETTRILQQAGLLIARIVVIVDREKDGLRKLKNCGYNTRALLTLSEIQEHFSQKSKL